MAFFGKFKTGSTQAANANAALAKKDPNAPRATSLEKHLVDVVGPVRLDGSDKFFGFENYGSTCYCNSIIQCLYYSAPFRENVISFPPKDLLEQLRERTPAPPLTLDDTTPFPNPTSPARKQPIPTSPGPGSYRQEDDKNPADGKKRLALTQGPVVGMTKELATYYGLDESLFTALRDIFEAIMTHDSRIGIVAPHRFLEILRRDNETFRSTMHQDAHEFLNLLLNQVVDSVDLFAKQFPNLAAGQANGGAPEKALASIGVSTNGIHIPKTGLDTRWVHDLFEGLLVSETRCLTCENTSQRDETFLDLSVDLGPNTSITSCLRKFSEEEMLCERNKFHCDNCGGLQEAEKRMKIKRLPKILALHLKRFKYTEDMQRLQKLFHRVTYPFYLRLFNTTDDAQDADRLYELYAVVVHLGGGAYHGHYVSIIKTQDRGWLLFDDELVEPVDKSYVMQFFSGVTPPPNGGGGDARHIAAAYVLFYQETTMEAMLREQDMEAGKPTPVPVRVSDETAMSPTKNGDGLAHIETAQTPAAEEMDHMDPVVHAATLPTVAQTARTPFEHVQNAPLTPVMPPKSKKELKQEEKERKVEEKERKAAKKAEDKAAEKAAEEKRREAGMKRMETWQRQDDQLKQALEMSKQTAVDEAKTRGDSPPLKESGLSRFRHSSMSFRKKPSIFSGKDKEKDKDKEKSKGKGKERAEVAGLSSQPNGHTPPVPPLQNGAPGPSQNGALAEERNDEPTALPQIPTASPSKAGPSRQSPEPEPEEKPKKNRFSLGRKRSAMI